jgi:hypothetical protein
MKNYLMMDMEDTMEWRPQTKRDALISTKNKNVTVEKRLCCHRETDQTDVRNDKRYDKVL